MVHPVWQSSNDLGKPLRPRLKEHASPSIGQRHLILIATMIGTSVNHWQNTKYGLLKHALKGEMWILRL